MKPTNFPPADKEAVRLLHEGTLALSKIESNGFRVDINYLNKTIEDCNRKITAIKNELFKTEVWFAWRKYYGERANIFSRAQLADILFNKLKIPYPPVKRSKTSTGRIALDEEVLSWIDLDFVKRYIELASLHKTANTFLAGIRKEVCGEYVHPIINLHIPITYRSSSEAPNMQNMPIRDKRAGEMIRRCFIPRDGRHLVEIDFSGIEVRIACCYHKDPVMRSYLLDDAKDMHRDMAAECYTIPITEVTKDIRHAGKNLFVFPQFYGAFYLDCAFDLWHYMKKYQLKTASGKKLEDVLKKNKIVCLGEYSSEQEPRPGTFIYHIREVERSFWEERFKVYNEWKNKWYDDYKKKGFIKTLTGFVISGLLRKNQVINAPIQGSAFHCLLWSIIEIQKWLDKYKMDSLIVNEIHDSVILDVTDSELDVVVEKCVEIMTKELPKAWKWINVPLLVEVETSQTNWFEKKKYAI